MRYNKDVSIFFIASTILRQTSKILAGGPAEITVMWFFSEVVFYCADEKRPITIFSANIKYVKKIKNGDISALTLYIYRVENWLVSWWRSSGI